MAYLDDRYEYQMIKTNNHNNFRHLGFRPTQTIEDSYYIPSLPGLIVALDANNEIHVSHSNDISRRMNELLKAPNTKNITHFRFCVVPDYYQRLSYRHSIRMHFLFKEIDKKGKVPQIA